MIEVKEKLNIQISEKNKIYQEFIDTWHEVEEGIEVESKEKIYFLDYQTFFKVLSKQRIRLLKILYENKAISINKLSKLLKRNYKNVYDDVKILKKIGLIKEDKNNKIYIAYSKINTEINLAA